MFELEATFIYIRKGQIVPTNKSL